MGRAILSVSHDLMSRVRASLPPGHSVVGLQENDALGCIDLVIEGPHFAGPPRVIMVVTQETDDAGKVKVSCKWTVVGRDYDRLADWTVPIERLEAADREDEPG